MSPSRSPVTERPADVFFDTVTLSNFALAGRLDIITGRYGQRACVTPEVLDEVLEGIAVSYGALSAIETALGEGSLGSTGALSKEELDIYRDLLRSLGPGQASCVACAKTRGGIVATDDRAARSSCANLRVAFTGTIGILIACCRDRTLASADADAILQAMVDAGYFSPVRRITDLL